MSIKDDMNAAKALIKAKRYNEARDILRNVNHVKAVEWLDKLDQLAPEPNPKAQPGKPKATPKQMGIGCLVILVPLILCCMWTARGTPETRAQNNIQNVTGVTRIVSMGSNDATQEISIMVCVRDAHLTNVTARAIADSARRGYGHQFATLLVMSSPQRSGVWGNGQIIGDIEPGIESCR